MKTCKNNTYKIGKYEYAFIILSMFLFLLLMAGCATKQECKPDIQIVYKTQDVYKEVPCGVPEVKCNFVGSGYEPTKKLLECVVEQKKAMAVCGKK